MRPLLSRLAVRALDADAVQRLGLPSIALMENAGRGAFEAITARFADRLERVVLVGGVGQNGGDAWVVARHLVCAGRAPRCVLVGGRDQVVGDAATNLGVLEALGITPLIVTDALSDDVDQALSAATLVVDGLFGTGLTRPIAGVHAAVIEAMQHTQAPIVALDLPSGIDADHGGVLGVAVKATLTATFAADKPGLHQGQGAACAGEIVRVSIGVPAPATAPIMALESLDIDAWLPARARDAHKGSSGHVLLVAGSQGTSGAAALSALGALRMGAGLVTVLTRAPAAEITGRHPEIMVRTLPDELSAAIRCVAEAAQGKASAVIGPGLGVDDFGRALAAHLAVSLPLPTVLDADALTAISADPSVLAGAAAPRVVTPHPGEAARLLGSSNAQVQADRYAAARALQARTGAIAVLKGAGTVIAIGAGELRVCPRGTPAMAVAGTGDVLAGATGTLLAQLPPATAACAAVYLHAVAGERAAVNDRGLLASELADALPAALVACRA